MKVNETGGNTYFKDIPVSGVFESEGNFFIKIEHIELFDEYNTRQNYDAVNLQNASLKQFLNYTKVNYYPDANLSLY